MNLWSADVLADHDADRADFAAILAHALREHAAGKGELTDLLGLEPAALVALTARWCPGLTLPSLLPLSAVPLEQADIVTLLLWRGGRTGDEARWLAAILARRSLETSHLWEDLGLPSRAHLGLLIQRHFPRLHAANTRNMRWKRFFYRQICSDNGGTMCLAPHCDDCAEKPVCFAPGAD
ncbi:nitrogen fixation protein NifQ [Rhodobacter sp. CZR27]|uniref:nitrogen fixation protein NifQ n=1 Tax=Rhodobacter sp. CZR27 TaxID=2033869 RepID=UPI000BBF36CD|nr:nitrogen fixation protein NifQ [Rhodobacter sp. CZR27]